MKQNIVEKYKAALESSGADTELSVAQEFFWQKSHALAKNVLFTEKLLENVASSFEGFTPIAATAPSDTALKFLFIDQQPVGKIPGTSLIRGLQRVADLIDAHRDTFTQLYKDMTGSLRSGGTIGLQDIDTPHYDWAHDFPYFLGNFHFEQGAKQIDEIVYAKIRAEKMLVVLNKALDVNPAEFKATVAKVAKAFKGLDVAVNNMLELKGKLRHDSTEDFKKALEFGEDCLSDLEHILKPLIAFFSWIEGKEHVATEDDEEFSELESVDEAPPIEDQAVPDNAASAMGTLDKLSGIVEQSKEGSGLDETSAQMLDVVVEQIYNSIGAEYRSRKVAMESFDTALDRKQATSVALETIGDTIKTAWKAFLDWLKKTWERITEFAKKLFSKEKAVEKKADEVAKSIEETKSETSKLPAEQLTAEVPKKNEEVGLIDYVIYARGLYSWSTQRFITDHREVERVTAYLNHEISALSAVVATHAKRRKESLDILNQWIERRANDNAKMIVIHGIKPILPLYHFLLDADVLEKLKKESDDLYEAAKTKPSINTLRYLDPVEAYKLTKKIKDSDKGDAEIKKLSDLLSGFNALTFMYKISGESRKPGSDDEFDLNQMVIKTTKLLNNFLAHAWTVRNSITSASSSLCMYADSSDRHHKSLLKKIAEG